MNVSGTGELASVQDFFDQVGHQTTKLLILCSKMKILWVESHDFSQAEKDITTVFPHIVSALE